MTLNGHHTLSLARNKTRRGNLKTHLLLKCLDVLVHVCLVNLTESLKKIERDGAIKLPDKSGYSKEVITVEVAWSSSLGHWISCFKSSTSP